jgi:hypothetical protein
MSSIRATIILINPAAGQDTERGDFDMYQTTTHHIIPAIRPVNGDNPTAFAIHRHNGIATKNTEIHATASFLKDMC